MMMIDEACFGLAPRERERDESREPESFSFAAERSQRPTQHAARREKRFDLASGVTNIALSARKM
jgi:hypothetical protein